MRNLYRTLGLVGVFALTACQGDAPRSGGSATGNEDDGLEADISLAEQTLSVAGGAVGDTVLRSGAPFANDGTGTTLGVTSASVADVKRSIIKMAVPAIPAGNVLYSARLELKITGVSVGWLGGGVDLFRMTRDWQEGNGLAGHGASWVCADDTNTTVLGNLTNNCSGANNWSMAANGPHSQPFFSNATARAPIFTGGVNSVSFDVTADVQQFINGTAVNHGWMLAGFSNPVGGEWVNFGSREGSAANRPQLIVEYGPDQCPTVPTKGVRGVCGCSRPDLDTNYDGVVDCVGGVATATADTTLRLAAPFSNDGRGVFLGSTSVSIVGLERSLVKVSNAAIDAARAGQEVTKATLELTVAGVAVGWPGGLLDLHRMNKSWVEGNPPGRGATWVCADDTDTSSLINQFLNNCSGSNTWGMQSIDLAPKPFDSTPSSTANFSWPGTRTVRFDVTGDVRAFLANPAANNGWLLKGDDSLISLGWVNFGSRESGAPPRLVLELSPACPPGVSKTAPGVCGCFRADTNSDGDSAPDCVDACPNDPSKTALGVCGCSKPDIDSDGDCLPDCADPCPADNDPSAGGQCGCPSSPKVAGSACGDSATGAFATCDGAGHCGNVQAAAPDASCACKLVKGPEEKSYWVCPCARTRAQADQACRARAGQELLEIEGPSENALIAGCLNQPVWTGANDLSTEGAWRWNTQGVNEDKGFWDGGATGTRHKNRYANWRSGEPAASPDCGAMDSRAAGGKWFANNCGNQLGYVCEYEQSHVAPPPKTTDTCQLLGYPCANPALATPCVSDASQFGGMTTKEQWQAAVDTCVDGIEQGATDCAAPLNKPVGNNCTPLAPGIDVNAPGVVCPLALPATTNVNALQTCDDPDLAAQCPAGQQCGYATRCANCDPGAGNCPPCTGDDQCGGARCQPFLACGTPACQFYCDNKPGTGGASCRYDSDCGTGQCGWTKRCALEVNGTRPECNEDVDCAPQGTTPNACLASKVCGEAVEDCFRNFDETVESCSEVLLCGTIAEQEETAVLEDSPIPSEITAASFDPPRPEPVDSKFEELTACVPGGSCATGPTPVQGPNHPFCNYDIPQAAQLPLRSTPEVDPNQKDSRAGSGKVKFNVTPDLDLDFDVKAGPLGLMLPKATARAAFLANVTINDLLKMGQKRLDIIDVLAELSAGLRPEEDLCGVSPGESRVRIFQINLLPADFLDDLRIPDEETVKKCVKAVAKFQDAVDRAKKAFFDAQALLKEYQRRAKADLTNPANYQTFPGPTLNAPDIPSLCDLLVKEPAPAGFEPATPNCHNEKPEDTINRFIRYYNKQLEVLVNEAVGKVADQVDGAIASGLASATGTASNTADGLGFAVPLANLHDLEEIVIVNQTFLIGPIPVLLQVLFTVEYGFQLNATIAVRVGAALKTALAFNAEGDGQPIVKAGLEGAPYAQAGIGLFVGIGFDIGIASASVGIQGNLTVGRISLPVHAGAGILMNAVDDRRTVTMPLPGYLKTLADNNYISPLQASFPVRKFSFGFQFQYGADLQLSKILQGSIDLRVRVKFFFFSKTWRKNVVKFNGLAPLNFTLFAGGAELGDGDWGTVEMPMPFFQLAEIKLADYLPVKDAMPAWNDFAHEQFLFDTQCSCIETFESVPVADQPDLRSCARKEDCCEKGNPAITCFADPAAGGAGKCTQCRDPGSWGGSIDGLKLNDTPGESCVEDEDCCPGNRCFERSLLQGVPGAGKVCMPLSFCGGGVCDSNDDCTQGVACSAGVCAQCPPPPPPG